MKSCFHAIEQIGRIRDDVYVSTSSPDGGTSRTSDDVMTLCVVEIASWRHWGRSLSSPTASCC